MQNGTTRQKRRGIPGANLKGKKSLRSAIPSRSPGRSQANGKQSAEERRRRIRAVTVGKTAKRPKRRKAGKTNSGGLISLLLVAFIAGMTYGKNKDLW